MEHNGHVLDFDPYTPAAIDDPYPNYARLRDEGRIMWSDKLTTWLVPHHADVLDFFRDDRLSADRMQAKKFRGAPKSSSARQLASDPPEHTVVRHLLTRTLTPAVQTAAAQLPELIDRLLDQAVERATHELLDRVEPQGTFDLVDDFAYPFPITVIAWLFDIPEQDRTQFGVWAHDLARNMDSFYKGRDAGMKARLADYESYVRTLVASRRADPGDDMVSELLRIEHEGEHLTDAEVQILCTTLIFAGHETTVNLISNATNALLDHRDQWERLLADPGLAATAVEEFLRFDSPAQMISRTALEDLEFHGAHIEAGDSVLAVVGSANRDPERFPDPDRLDVGRAPNPHLAFGAGIHFCPGAQLTRLEARAALPRLVERLPSLSRAEAPARRRPTAVLRGFEHLPVRL